MVTTGKDDLLSTIDRNVKDIDHIINEFREQILIHENTKKGMLKVRAMIEDGEL